jgi:hypothetical protein
MKLSLTGMLVELEKITFKVGAYLTATFEFGGNEIISERVRSIKHYDKFYRKPPSQKKKEPAPDEPPPPAPKKLAEFHFHAPTERTKTLITKFQLRQQLEENKKKR